jgi:MFS family permease
LSSNVQPRNAFAFPPFKLWQWGRLCWVVGSQMQSVALGWHIYDITGRPLDLGLIGLAQFGPVALFSLIGGAVADRVDRGRLLMTCLMAHALLSSFLVATAVIVPERIWPIYAVAVGLGTVKAFSAPAAKALLPSLVPDAFLENAVAWSSGLFQMATIAGPALGGFVLAIDDRPWVTYAVAAGLAGAASVLIARIPAVPRSEVVASSRGYILSGVRFVFAHPLVLGSITLDLLAVLAGGATALLPVFAKDILHAGPVGLGLLRAAPAVGAASMAMVLVHLPITRRAGRALFISVGIFGLATMGFGLSRHLLVSLVCLVALGAADMVSMVIRGVLIQRATPDEMRGRVAAVSSLFIVASNELGELESGLAAALLGTVTAVVAGGVVSVAVVLVCAVAFPTLRRADRL